MCSAIQMRLTISSTPHQSSGNWTFWNRTEVFKCSFMPFHWVFLGHPLVASTTFHNMLSFGRHIQNLSAKAASSLHALKCAASIKFLPIADWIHCTRSWNFRVIDLAIWKCCLEFLLSLLLSIPCTYAFQLLLFIHSELSLHLSLQFLISVSIFSFCSLFFDCCKSLVRYPFLFLLRLDAYNRFCGYFQQD